MRKIFVILFIASFAMASAQDSIIDTVQIINKERGKIELLHKGENLTFDQLYKLTSSNPEAYAMMKKAKNNIGGAKAIGYAGGFLIGYTLGVAMFGDDPPWVAAAIGAGVLMFAIPLGKSYRKNLVEAVDIYNKGLLPEKSNSASLSLGTTNNGVGLILSLH